MTRSEDNGRVHLTDVLENMRKKGCCQCPMSDMFRTMRTFFIVLSTLVVSFVLTSPPSASEYNPLRCTLGNHVRRVFFFEKGTLLPYCTTFPPKRPSCDRLNGVETGDEKDLKQASEGNMRAKERSCSSTVKKHKISRVASGNFWIETVVWQL